MKLLILLPLLIPLTTALVCLATLRKQRLQAPIGIGGAGLLVLAALAGVIRVTESSVFSLQIGDWPAPFGITLVADYVSAGMVMLTGLIALAVSIYAAVDIDMPRRSHGFFAQFHFLLMGVCGAFLAGDMFNFYVWFEVSLTASFVLIALGGMKSQLRGSIKYLALNLIASALLLAGIGLLYRRTGTLNMADLALRIGVGGQASLLAGPAMLFFVAFGIKAGLFPLFFWLPAAYHTPPASVSALFAGLLTKLGLYAMLRTFSLFFMHDGGFNQSLILIVSGASMVTGALGALTQTHLNRLLSFSIVSQMGYILMGLGIFTPLAMAGAFFFMLHESIAKTAMFLISGIIGRRYQELNINRLGGVFDRHPYLSAGFLIAGLSLAGLPPLTGFLAKYALIRAGLADSRGWMAAIALAVALLTLLYILRIWQLVFWRPRRDFTPTAHGRLPAGLVVPALGLALLSLIFGIFGRPVVDFCLQAGHQLVDPTVYIDAVLGGAK